MFLLTNHSGIETGRINLNIEPQSLQAIGKSVFRDYPIIFSGIFAGTCCTKGKSPMCDVFTTLWPFGHRVQRVFCPEMGRSCRDQRVLTGAWPMHHAHPVWGHQRRHGPLCGIDHPRVWMTSCALYLRHRHRGENPDGKARRVWACCPWACARAPSPPPPIPARASLGSTRCP